jgi:hypothetical protein
MSRRIAFPFLTLQDPSVLAQDWRIAVGHSELLDSGEWLPDWDASIPLRLSRSFGIDFATAARDLEIDADNLKLAVILRIGSGQGRLSRSIIDREHRVLDAEHPVTVLEVTIDGSQLSSVLDLHVDITLADDCGTGSDLSPSRKGDRVWRDTARIRLEGEEPRLPIEVADLSSLLTGVATFAPWYLEWSPRDWSRDFHGAIRLYLSSGHQNLITRIEAEDTEVLRILMADVMSQVCESLLREPDAAFIFETCAEGSIGAQVEFWLKLAFPGRDVRYAKSLLEQRPGLFRASMQALANQQVQDI